MALHIDKAIFRPLTADPSPLVDGLMWYRDDLNQFRRRLNGVTEVWTIGDSSTGTVPINITSGVTSGAATSGFLASTNNRIEYEMQGSGAGASKVIYYSIVVPQDYVSGGTVDVDSWTNDFTNLTTWTLTGYINGTIDSVLAAVDISPTADTTYQTTSTSFTDTIAAGDVLMLKLDFTGVNGDDVRVDRVDFEFNK